MLLPSDLLGHVAALVVVLVAFALKATTFRDKSPKTRGGKPLPRPESTLPLLENTLDMLANMSRMHDWIMETSLKLGGRPWLLKVLGQPHMIVISTPEAFEDVQHRNFDKFGKGPYLYDIFHDLGGNNVSMADGELWAYQRKTAARLFTSRAIREHMTAIVDKHIVVLDEVLHKAATSNKVVDIAELMLHFTLETIAEIAFGLDLQCLMSDEVHPFEKALDDAQHISISRAQMPTFVWKLKRLLGIGSEKELKKSISVVDETIMAIINKTMAKSREEKESGKISERKDAVSLFLDSEESDDMLTPELLRDAVLSLIIGGRDTTAGTLAWLMYCLAQHPKVEQKVREEITVKHGTSFDTTRNLTREEFNQLPYLEAIIKETLRLYPAISWNPRYCFENAVLSDGTFIPQGSHIIMTPYTMGQRTDVWGGDAAQFKPERWIDPKDPTKLITVSNYKFNTFLAGPRQCIGQNLAMLEMKMVVTKVLSKFHLELVAGQDVTYRQSLALPIKNGLKVRVCPMALDS